MSGIIAPQYQSATKRRDLRRKIRNALGTSSDRAPGPETAIRAAGEMADLLAAATNGTYTIQIQYRGEPISYFAALDDIRERGRNE